MKAIIWIVSSEFGTYRLCEQRRFRWACASAQSLQNLHCWLIQAVSQDEPSDRKPDPWSLWMAGHAQLKFVMTECSKTQIRLTGLIYSVLFVSTTTTFMMHYVIITLLKWFWPGSYYYIVWSFTVIFRRLDSYSIPILFQYLPPQLQMLMNPPMPVTLTRPGRLT